MTLSDNDNKSDILEQAHLAYVRGKFPQACQMLESFLAVNPHDQPAQHLLVQIRARQVSREEAILPITSEALKTAGKPLHRLAVFYNNLLMAPSRPDQIPPVMYLLIFCPLALLGVIALGLSYFIDLWHGVPLDGSVPCYSDLKHGGGRESLCAVRPPVTVSLIICAVCIPLLLSVIACLRGWLGNDDEQ